MKQMSHVQSLEWSRLTEKDTNPQVPSAPAGVKNTLLMKDIPE